MYKILKGGFDCKDIDELSRIRIYDCIRESFKQFKDKTINHIESGFIIHNISLVNQSKKMDGWVEFTVNINRAKNSINFIADKLIVYDQMPDYVLDRINELGIYKQGEQVPNSDKIMITVHNFMKWFKANENANK